MRNVHLNPRTKARDFVKMLAEAGKGVSLSTVKHVNKTWAESSLSEEETIITKATKKKKKKKKKRRQNVKEDRQKDFLGTSPVV